MLRRFSEEYLAAFSEALCWVVCSAVGHTLNGIRWVRSCHGSVAYDCFELGRQTTRSRNALFIAHASKCATAAMLCIVI